MPKPPNEIVQLSFDFAVDTVRLVKKLPRSSDGLVLGRQLARSGTSIGANVEEAQGARTRPECVNLMNIAKREAREACYWLRVLRSADVIPQSAAARLLDQGDRLVRLLTSIVKTSEQRSANPHP